MLETSVAGVEARFAVEADGSVAGVELWTAPDADPCEVRFRAAPADRPETRRQTRPQDLPRNAPQGMPASIEVRHGNDVFGVFNVEGVVLDRDGDDAGGDAAKARAVAPETEAGTLPGGAP
jgi:hypothetical protein